jgi:predicted nucleotidyltransferase component of viral defense system
VSSSSNKAASVHQKLLNRARAEGEDFQALLLRYVLERFLYRLSRSPHRDRFVVKGAMLFVLWEGNLHRMTRDLDLLGFGATTSIIEVEQAIREIVATEVEDDGVVIAADTVRGGLIREEQAYEGVRVTADAQVGNARVRVKVDIGFGDVITPEAEEVAFPTLLGDPSPVLRAYPKETVVAEKLQAMVVLGILNSRMKDFYDLWHLARSYAFDDQTLTDAVIATFARRGATFPEDEPLALTEEFATDVGKRVQWRAFVRRGRLRSEAPFEEVIVDLRRFLLPVLEAARTGSSRAMHWKPGGPWAKWVKGARDLRL